MTRALAALTCLLGLTSAALAANPDAQMNRYFSIWSHNASITPQTVSELYANRVTYYGKSMSAAAVYRDKLNFIRRWPDRRYRVVPGSVSKTCDAAQETCKIYAILSWEKTNPRDGQGSKGANTIALTLKRENGLLKIARESGTPVAESSCRSVGPRRSCSSYR